MQSYIETALSKGATSVHLARETSREIYSKLPIVLVSHNAQGIEAIVQWWTTTNTSFAKLKTITNIFTEV